LIGEPTHFDPETIDALGNIRDQADAALRSAGPRFATFLAFSAANGALKAADDHEGSTGFVSRRVESRHAAAASPEACCGTRRRAFCLHAG
jgi:hypothetical protein